MTQINHIDNKKVGVRATLTAGLAMFSMFFGSGNLVFPLAMGSQIQDQWHYGTLGFMITAVIVPFLGLYAIILYHGHRKDFFESIGVLPAFLITFSILALLGPIGVVPRCITVTYGGCKLLFPNVPFWAFSLGFCLLTGLLIWSHKAIINLIGKAMTPILIGGIITVIIAGLCFSDAPSSTSKIPREAFIYGLIEGYQTMDLLAAFFFATTIVQFLRSSTQSAQELDNMSLRASCIGASLLGVVYIGFIIIGARFAPDMTGVTPDSMLVFIAEATLGPLAKPIACLTITMACLTTATILASLFSEFVCEELSRNRIAWHQAVIGTLMLSFLVSLFGFESIRQWLSFILKITYPALIALTLANIIQKWFGFDKSKISFWATFAISASIMIFLR